MAQATTAPTETPPGEGGTRRRQGDGPDLPTVLKENFGIEVDTVLPEDVSRVIEDVEDRLDDMENHGGVRLVRRNLQRARLLIDMLRSWRDGRTRMPWRTAAAITGGLIYVVDPGGWLPGFIKGEDSLLDEALVLYLCYRLVKADLRRFAEEQGLETDELGL